MELQGRRPRRRFAMGLVAALAAAAIAVAGCGGGGSRAAAGASDVAAFIPAGTPVYVEMSTDASGSQWQQAITLARRFPGYGKVVAELSGKLAADGIDFDAQIKPLLGSSAAIGVLDIAGTATGRPDPSVIGALDLADGKEADFLRLIQSGRSPATKVGQHAGVDLYGGSRGDGVVAVLDGKVVFGDTRDNLIRAIDAHRAGDAQTMAGSSRLDDVFAELPDEVLAQGFVDIGGLIRVRQGSGGRADLAKQLADIGLGADAAAGLSVSAEADGIRLKGVGLNLGGAYRASEPFTPKLVDRVPADAVAYYGLRNLYRYGEQAIAQLGAQSTELRKGLSQAALALPLLGITLDDVKGLAGLEFALVVTKGAPTPGVVAALEVADPARARATLDTLRRTAPSLLAKSGTRIPGFEQVPLANGVTGWQSAITPEAGVVYGVDGNLALIGTLPGAVKQVQAPAASLADDPAYQAATRQMPPKVDGLIWVNGERLLTTLDAMGALKSLPRAALPNLRPLRNLAAWVIGGDKPSFELFVTIR